MTPDTCPESRRADLGHAWHFDGDDPYVICAWCDEIRDALTERVIREGTDRPGTTTHLSPPEDMSVTPCCGRTAHRPPARRADHLAVRMNHL